jgi:NAD(P)-dependent dehydrogenase (short-subunit alcohol dehydrogenase family)
VSIADSNFFRDRYVVLTGAGRPGQVGEIIAREFARRGAILILVARDLDTAGARLADLASQGHVGYGFGCDLASENEVTALAGRIDDLCRSNGLAALINAAGGFAMSGNVAASSFDVWKTQFSINLTTCYLTTRALLPLLRKGKGSIVNFATGAALSHAGVAEKSAYVAAKSGVAVLTRAVAQEERDNGVRANAIAPNAIRTAVNIASMGDKARYVERETVAETVLFLCSPAASAITGEIIRLT